MKKIKMQNSSQETLEEVFERFLAASAARGVKEKTLSTYKQHFKAISKRLNPETPIQLLSKKDLESMISRMRTEGLSDTTISSYTRTLKVFFSWSSSENITSIDISIYKAAETYKETYSDACESIVAGDSIVTAGIAGLISIISIIIVVGANLLAHFIVIIIGTFHCSFFLFFLSLGGLFLISFVI